MKLKLPSALAFAKLSVLARTKLFLKWAKTKNPKSTYDSGSCDNCALAQFGKAIGGDEVKALSCMISFKEGGEYIEVIGGHINTPCASPIHGKNIYARTSFGSLVNRLTKLLETV